MPYLSTVAAEVGLAGRQFGDGSMGPKVAAAIEFVRGSTEPKNDEQPVVQHKPQRRAFVCAPGAIYDVISSKTADCTVISD